MNVIVLRAKAITIVKTVLEKMVFAHLLPIYVAVKNQIVIFVQNLLSKILKLWVIASTAKHIGGT